MSLRSLVQSLYQGVVGSDNVRYVAIPGATVAGVATVSDGAAAANAFSAYVQICALAGGAGDPEWLSGYYAATGVVESIRAVHCVGVGGAGAEVDRAQFGVNSGIPTAVGIAIAVSQWLPKPVRIIGNPRVAVRIYKDTAASAAGTTSRVLFSTGVGT